MAKPAQIGEYRDIIDARSPAEYAEDHIPGAVNLPAFSNSERAAIGTLYKADPFAARRQGAALFTANVAQHLGSALAGRPPDWRPLVYCARGGQRSGGMVEVLRRIGWRAEQLAGGYKAYRQHVIATIRDCTPRLRWVVIAGKTGVGKTRLLAALARIGAQVVDLEQMANHRGSVFGTPDGEEQPAQRRFETRLCAALAALKEGTPVFIEAESRRIGSIHLPAELLAAIRSARAVRLEAALAARVQHILRGYKMFCDDAAHFNRTIDRLKPFAGNARITHWRAQHEQGEWQPLVADLLANFYDIGYEKSLRANYAAAYASAPLEVNPNDEAQLLQVAREVLCRCRQQPAAG